MRRILITLLILSLTSIVYAEKIRVWVKGDDIKHTVCPEGIEYDKCIADALKGNSELVTYDFKDIDRSEMPTEDGRAWEWDANAKKVKVNRQKLKQIEKEDRERKLIEAEKQKILEDQAIANLKARGEIQ